MSDINLHKLREWVWLWPWTFKFSRHVITESGFPRLLKTTQSIFHVFPKLFNPVDIEEVGFLYTFTKSIICVCKANRSTDNCK